MPQLFAPKDSMGRGQHMRQECGGRRHGKLPTPKPIVCTSDIMKQIEYLKTSHCENRARSLAESCTASARMHTAIHARLTRMDEAMCELHVRCEGGEQQAGARGVDEAEFVAVMKPYTEGVVQEHELKTIFHRLDKTGDGYVPLAMTVGEQKKLESMLTVKRKALRDRLQRVMGTVRKVQNTIRGMMRKSTTKAKEPAQANDQEEKRNDGEKDEPDEATRIAQQILWEGTDPKSLGLHNDQLQLAPYRPGSRHGTHHSVHSNKLQTVESISNNLHAEQVYNSSKSHKSTYLNAEKFISNHSQSSHTEKQDMAVPKAVQRGQQSPKQIKTSAVNNSGTCPSARSSGFKPLFQNPDKDGDNNMQSQAQEAPNRPSSRSTGQQPSQCGSSRRDGSSRKNTRTSTAAAEAATAILLAAASEPAEEDEELKELERQVEELRKKKEKKEKLKKLKAELAALEAEEQAASPTVASTANASDVKPSFASTGSAASERNSDRHPTLS